MQSMGLAEFLYLWGNSPPWTAWVGFHLRISYQHFPVLMAVFEILVSVFSLFTSHKEKEMSHSTDCIVVKSQVLD